MRISEASAASGASTRLLRYYEEQGLLAPTRDTSGYRSYTETDVQVVGQIRQLLDAGLSTATIRRVLPCVVERLGRLEPICAELVADLRREQERIETSIRSLEASRDAIAHVVNNTPWQQVAHDKH